MGGGEKAAEQKKHFYQGLALQECYSPEKVLVLTARGARTTRHYVSPSPPSSHHRPSPGQQLMTCLAARRQISTEIEAVR